MSSEASDSSTDTPAQQSESTTVEPTLTVVATGPATFTRQVSGDDEATILAEHDTVELSIERELQSADDFETVIDPMFDGNGPTVSKTMLIDRLLDEHAMDGYQRAGNRDDWALEITGTTADWKQISLDLVPDLHRSSTDEGAAVRRLWNLAADGVTNDGAVLAALDLVDQHDIDTRREKLTDLLTDVGDGK
jgi:hypothetical protein